MTHYFKAGAAVLLLCSLLQIKTVNANNPECDAYANELADEFQKDTKELIQDFEQSVKALKASYIKNRTEDAGKVFEKILEIQKDNNRYDPWMSLYLDIFPKQVRNYSNDKKNKHLCNNHYRFGQKIDSNLERLDSVLETTIEDIEARIDLETLGEDEGYAVISAYAYGLAGVIQLKSKALFGDYLNIGPLFRSQYFRLIKLKKGEYFWSRVKMPSYNISTYRYYDFSDNGLSFTVQPGKINLTGVFLYEKTEDRATADVIDRTAIILKLLEQRYPILIKELEWVNSLAPSDPFIAFYRQQKASVN